MSSSESWLIIDSQANRMSVQAKMSIGNCSLRFLTLCCSALLPFAASAMNMYISAGRCSKSDVGVKLEDEALDDERHK